MAERLEVRIEMENALMLGNDDAAFALDGVARRLRLGESRGAVMDANGNTVGEFRFVGEPEPVRFREEECGGAFDGFTVSSDADSGL